MNPFLPGRGGGTQPAVGVPAHRDATTLTSLLAWGSVEIAP